MSPLIGFAAAGREPGLVIQIICVPDLPARLAPERPNAICHDRITIEYSATTILRKKWIIRMMVKQTIVRETP